MSCVAVLLLLLILGRVGEVEEVMVAGMLEVVSICLW